MYRVGLVDVDGHNGFPNLALMKLSAYHKSKGHLVSWANPLEPYDEIHMSKIFTFTKDDDSCYNSPIVFRGGGLGIRTTPSSFRTR